MNDNQTSTPAQTSPQDAIDEVINTDTITSLADKQTGTPAASDISASSLPPDPVSTSANQPAVPTESLVPEQPIISGEASSLPVSELSSSADPLNSQPIVTPSTDLPEPVSAQAAQPDLPDTPVVAGIGQTITSQPTIDQASLTPEPVPTADTLANDTEPQQTPPDLPKGSGLKTAGIALGAVAILVLGAGGFYFFQGQNKNTPAQTSTQQTSPSTARPLETFLAAGVSVDSEAQDSIDKITLVDLGQKNLKTAKASQSIAANIVNTTYRPKQSVFGDGSTAKPYQITAIDDPVCQGLHPVDIKTEYDEEAKTLTLYWTSADQTIIPYMHLAGYWFTDFDQSQKFNIELLAPEEMIEWSQNVNETTTDTAQVKTLVLDLDNFKLYSPKAYYYLYARTVIGDTYLDCLYSDQNTNKAFTFTLP